MRLSWAGRPPTPRSRVGSRPASLGAEDLPPRGGAEALLSGHQKVGTREKSQLKLSWLHRPMHGAISPVVFSLLEKLNC